LVLYGRPCSFDCRYRQPVEFREFIAELQQTLRGASVVMRPHWGKLHNITHTELAATFEHFGSFLDVRQRLDPNGMFLNNYLKEIFGL
jgi:hypothetical protein